MKLTAFDADFALNQVGTYYKIKFQSPTLFTTVLLKPPWRPKSGAVSSTFRPFDVTHTDAVAQILAAGLPNCNLAMTSWHPAFAPKLVLLTSDERGSVSHNHNNTQATQNAFAIRLPSKPFPQATTRLYSSPPPMTAASSTWTGRVELSHLLHHLPLLQPSILPPSVVLQASVLVLLALSVVKH